MSNKDYYAVLGVSENVDAATLKKTYRKLARKYHPDVSSEADSEEKFKEVGEAYEVLKDIEKRAQYDLFRSELKNTSSRSSQSRTADKDQFSTSGMENMEGFSEFMESIFSARNSQQPPPRSRHRGEDIHARLALFIEEAHAGCERVIEYQLPEHDDYGRVIYTTKKIKVKIPENSSIDKPIRLKGQGGMAEGDANNGDLYLDLEFAPHPIYSFKGKDLYRKLAVTPWEATLGTSLLINTLYGEVLMKINPDSQSGQQLRLKGKGLADFDLIIELDIVIPKEHSDEIKSLYQKISDISSFNPREESVK